MFKRFLFASLILTAPALADAPVIENVRTTRSGDLWTFDVTISHGDTGWDHYADAWRILGNDGTELGVRNLAHPHVDEQPFTRSLSGIRIPAEITEVEIQARDNVAGWAPGTVRIRLK